MAEFKVKTRAKERLHCGACMEKFRDAKLLHDHLNNCSSAKKLLAPLKDSTPTIKTKSRPSQNELTYLTKLCDKYKALATKYQEQLKELVETKHKAETLEIDIIPQAASEIGESGLTMWSMGDGTKVEIIDELKAAIPEKSKVRALQIIKQHKGEAIIKTEIILKFDGEDIEQKKKLKMLLNEEGFLFEEKLSIHAATLKSWVKGLIEKGVEFDKKTFGVWEFKKCKIKGVALKAK